MQRKLNFFINFKQRCLFVLTYANAQGRWGLWDRLPPVGLVEEDRDLWGRPGRAYQWSSTHLVIKSEPERASVLIRQRKSESQTVWLLIWWWLFLILHLVCWFDKSKISACGCFISFLLCFCLSPHSSSLCCLKICLRSSTLSWRRSPIRSSPSRGRPSLMWSNTCVKIRSPMAWSMPYPR